VANLPDTDLLHVLLWNSLSLSEIVKLHLLEHGSNCFKVGQLSIIHVNLSQRPFNAILEHLHLFRNLQQLDLSSNDIKPALLNKLSTNLKKLGALTTLILEK